MLTIALLGEVVGGEREGGADSTVLLAVWNVLGGHLVAGHLAVDADLAVAVSSSHQVALLDGRERLTLADVVLAVTDRSHQITDVVTVLAARYLDDC